MKNKLFQKAGTEEGAEGRRDKRLERVGGWAGGGSWGRQPEGWHWLLGEKSGLVPGATNSLPWGSGWGNRAGVYFREFTLVLMRAWTWGAEVLAGRPGGGTEEAW